MTTTKDNAMKIELKNVKHYPAMSEETPAFSATIYIDDKKAGEAKNDGRGGMTWITPFDTQARIAEYAKSLPPRTYSLDGKQTFTHNLGADDVIDDLFYAWQIAGDLKRAMTGRALIVTPEGVIQQTVPKVSPIDLKARLANEAWCKATANGGTILNLLPFDEALKLYRAGAKS
jgi:hypothetical protein